MYSYQLYTPHELPSDIQPEYCTPSRTNVQLRSSSISERYICGERVGIFRDRKEIYHVYNQIQLIPDNV